MRFARLAAVVLAAAASSPVAYAQEPSPSPPPAPVVKDTEKEVDVAVYTWSKIAVGAPDAAIRFGGGLELRGPLAFGRERSFGVIGVRLDIDTLPDKSGDVFDDLHSWGNYAEVEGFWSKRFGSLTIPSGRVTTSFIVTGRTTFGTVGGEDDAPPPRALRAYGGGVALEWFRGSSIDHVSIVYGRDEAVGPAGAGQLQVRGSIQIRGALRVMGEFAVGFGSASLAGDQRDYMTAGLAVNLADLIPK